MPNDTCESDSTTNWNRLAGQCLDGHGLTHSKGLSILTSDDSELLSLLDAAFQVRHHYFGNQVQLYYLKNAKSGLCPEDCGYCSQAADSQADIQKYSLLNEEKLMEGARQAAESRARTFCIVASGRGPTHREVDHISSVVAKIKQEYGLHICCCLGLLNSEQARQLKAAGVDRINHNLNTSRGFYDQICTTHTFDDRLQTLRVSRDAGMELCCGFIAGMGETKDDVVEVALQLRDLDVQSIPINFLISIDGTQLEDVHELDPRYCLKVLCLFRFANPNTELRIAGGRETNLRSMQAMGLYPANSMFVSDYLTTKGQSPEDDFRMVEDLGFEIVTGDHESNALLQSS